MYEHACAQDIRHTYTHLLYAATGRFPESGVRFANSCFSARNAYCYMLLFFCMKIMLKNLSNYFDKNALFRTVVHGKDDVFWSIREGRHEAPAVASFYSHPRTKFGNPNDSLRRESVSSTPLRRYRKLAVPFNRCGFFEGREGNGSSVAGIVF